VVRLTHAEAVKSRKTRSDEPDAAAEGAAGGEEDGAAAGADDKLERLDPSATYRVVHAPFIFLRAAPARDAEVMSVLTTAMEFEADALRCGWVRTAKPVAPMADKEAKPRKAWALIDGAEAGLGQLLKRVS